MSFIYFYIDLLPFRCACMVCWQGATRRVKHIANAVRLLWKEKSVKAEMRPSKSPSVVKLKKRR